MRFLVVCLLASLTGCYAEWDIPKVPRRDPCTNEVADHVVYVQPACPNPSPRNPHDLDFEVHGYGH